METKRNATRRIDKGDKSKQILDVLRQRIASHEIVPGSRLREGVFVTEFGVTRARIREVFSALEALGLVERVHNRGTIVCRLELDDVFEIYEVREALEGACARLAARNLPGEPWQDLVDLYAPQGLMEQYVAEKDIISFFEEYEKLRERMVTAADNLVLTRMLDGIYAQTKIIIRRVMILPGRPEQALIEHRAIVNALRDGDVNLAEVRRRENIRNAIKKLERYQNWVF